MNILIKIDPHNKHERFQMTYKIIKFDPNTAIQKMWQRYHDFFMPIAEECYPNIRINSREVTERVIRPGMEMWITTHWMLYNQEMESFVGRMTYEYAEDDLESCRISIHISKEYRMNGLSMVLMKKAVESMREDKRTKMIISTESFIEYSEEWAQKLGFKNVQTSSQNRIFVDDIDDGLMSDWASILEEDDSIELELWENMINEDHMGKLVSLIQDFHNNAPRGEDESQIINVDESFCRQYMKWHLDKGYEWLFLTAYKRESGELIAWTNLFFDKKNREHVNQGGTGVLSRYTGNGYAKSIKASMYRRLMSKYSEASYIVTENAEENESINYINEKIGFKHWYSSKTWQISLDEGFSWMESD